MLMQTFRTVRGLTRPLRILFVTTLVFRSGTIAFPFLAAYLLATGDHGSTEVGYVVGAYGFGALLADVSAGPLLRVLTGRSIMLMGLLGNAALVSLLPLAGGLPVLVAATFVWGFFYEVFTPASYTEIVEHCPDEDRKVAFSCHRLAINIGMGIGPAVGGLIYAWQPVGLFVVNAGLVIVAAVYLFSHPFNSTQQDEARPRGRLVARSLKGETRFWTIFLLSMPIHMAFALPPVFLSAYVIHERDMASMWAGMLFFLNAGLIVLFEVPLNTAMRRLSHYSSLLIGYALTAVGFALMGVFGMFWGLAMATVLWTVAEMIVFPSLMHYVSDVSDEEVVGRNMGLYSAGVNVGLISMPTLSFLWTSQFGPSGPWLVMGGLVAVALLLIIAVKRSSYMWVPGDRSASTQHVA
ncbi:MFS transporter [Haloglycomyces albus]|uniref:MFS transporter n=1 Tax=Haloglycomyces albus TaxID=526067 RepID=UPI000684C8C2|nr:MFS transporter [Haloglycomyces albus]